MHFSKPSMQTVRTYGAPRFRSGMRVKTGAANSGNLAHLASYVGLADGGGLSAAANAVASAGRGRDTELAHFDPDELALLDAMHGQRQVNPHTGLPEYGWLGSLVKGLVRATASIVGGSIAGPAGAALGAGLSTKLTGGSWNDALKAGAVSGIGNYAMQGVSGQGWDPTGPDTSAATDMSTMEKAVAAGNPEAAATQLDSAGTELTDNVLANKPGAVDSFWQYAKSKPGMAAALGALSVPIQSSSSATVPNVAGTGPSFSVQPMNRTYIPFTGDPTKYGMGKAHQFYDNVNPAPIYGPQVPGGIDYSNAQGYADGGAVSGLADQSQLANLLRGFQMAKRGGGIGHFADGGGMEEITVNGNKDDTTGQSLGGNPIVVPSGPGYDPSTIIAIPDQIKLETQGFWDRIKSGIGDAVKTGVYDVTHPLKGLQDVISKVTGLQFKDGNFTIPEGEEKNFPNMHMDSDATFQPTGINPLAAASNFFPPAALANMVMSVANVDPNVDFDTMMKAIDKGSDLTHFGQVADASGNYPDPNPPPLAQYMPGSGYGNTSSEFIPQVPDVATPSQSPPVRVADNTPPNSINISNPPPDLGMGNSLPPGIGGGGVPDIPIVAPASNAIAPTSTKPGPGYVPPPAPAVVAGKPGTQMPTTVASNAVTYDPASAARTYIPFTGDPTKYGFSKAHTFYAADGGSPDPAMAARMAAMQQYGFASGGHASGPGSGQDDKIPAMLSDGEYVMDADTVANIGDGSSKEGIRRLDDMRRKIRLKKRAAPASKIPPKTGPLHIYLKGLA